MWRNPTLPAWLRAIVEEAAGLALEHWMALKRTTARGAEQLKWWPSPTQCLRPQPYHFTMGGKLIK